MNKLGNANITFFFDRNQPEVKEHSGVIGKAFVIFRNS